MDEAQESNSQASQSIEKARHLMRMGRHEDAVPFLLNALSSHPDDDVLHCQLADAFHQLDDVAQSRFHGQQALQLNPNNDEAHFRLAWNCMREKNIDGALFHAKEAVRLDPDDASNFYTLAWAEYHSGHSGEALDAAKRSIEIEPENFEMHQLAGDMFMNLNKYSQAILHYKTALQFNPESPDVHNHLGNALLSENKVNEALNHFLIAVKLEPDEKEYREDLFDIVHGKLLNSLDMSPASVLASLDPAVRIFYQDAMLNKEWYEKLRVGSIAALWLLLLLILALFFTWATGDSIQKLIWVTGFVGLAYSVMFVGLRAIRYIRIRKYNSEADLH